MKFEGVDDISEDVRPPAASFGARQVELRPSSTIAGMLETDDEWFARQGYPEQAPAEQPSLPESLVRVRCVLPALLSCILPGRQGAGFISVRAGESSVSYRSLACGVPRQSYVFVMDEHRITHRQGTRCFPRLGDASDGRIGTQAASSLALDLLPLIQILELVSHDQNVDGLSHDVLAEAMARFELLHQLLH